MHTAGREGRPRGAATRRVRPSLHTVGRRLAGGRAATKSQTSRHGEDDGARRRASEAQLARAKDLYVAGDFTLEQYEAHQRVRQAELATLEPPMLSDASDAAAALADSGWFWNQETDASERNKILRLIFEQVTVDAAQIASVTPREGFLHYFQFGRKSGG